MVVILSMVVVLIDAAGHGCRHKRCPNVTRKPFFT